MKKWLVVIVIIVSMFIAFISAQAGNHEVIHPTKGHSIGWEKPTAIPYWLDLGPLGTLSNTQARILVKDMLGKWAAVDTAKASFSYQGDLPEDVTEENVADYLAMASCGSSSRKDIPTNVVPIVFDDNGQIIEYLTGVGSASEVGGLSTLRCFVGSLENPTAIFQGMVIINGQFIDGKDVTEFSPKDLSVNSVAGVMLHELGHLIGLDHSALNEEIYDDIANGDLSKDYSRFLPVMLPTVLRASNSSTTLHPDDISALSTLYPSDDFPAMSAEIKGQVLDNAGQEVRKVNVIARRDDDPLCEAVATLSGRRCTPLIDAEGTPNFNMTTCLTEELYGDYAIEGLLPGAYTVEVEELEAGWIRDGMYPDQIDEDLPGDAEFYNVGDAAGESPFDFSLVNVAADEVARSIDFELSASASNEAQINRVPLNKFEAGPGTRCITDSVDYEVVLLGSEDGEIDPSLSFDSGDGKTSSDNANGGCQLIDSENNYGGILMTIILLAIFGLVKRCSFNKNRILIMSCAALVTVASAAKASTVIPTDLKGMSVKAGKIFHGRCKDVKIEKDERGLTSTIVTYEILRGVKGVDSKDVTFKIFGMAGTTKQTASEKITGVSNFHEGREDVLFLYKESPWGFTSPVGLWQGSFPVIRDGDNAQLSKKSKAFQKTIGAGTKAVQDFGREIKTPDDLLDAAEEILEQ